MVETKMGDLTPDRVGLTQKDIMFLFVYKELSTRPQHPAAIYQTMQQMVDTDLMKSRAYLYKVIEEMDSKSWITFREDGRKKIYSVTRKGEEQLKQYRDTYLMPFQSIKTLSGFIAERISGSWSGTIPSDIPKDTRKLFNRLINVRELATFLFLSILSNTGSQRGRLTAKDIFELMEQHYAWTCSVGYIYETAHAIEEAGWVHGQWLNHRRSDYLYRITEDGEAYLPQAAERAMMHARKCYHFMNRMIPLLEAQE